MQTRWIGAGSAALLTLMTWTSSAHANFACETVARRGQSDPVLAEHKSFREPAAVNDSGDVLFIGQPKRSKEKIYLYPAGGPNEIVAQVLGPAPNGGLFSPGGVHFDRLSLSSNGHLAFFGPTTVGLALFAREAGGALETVAQQDQVAPSSGGLRWGAFPSLSRINTSGDLAFIGTVPGGTDGVFRFNVVTDTVVRELSDGVAALSGRLLCNIIEVELSDSGNLALLADSNVACGDATTLRGIFLSAPGGIQTVALQGDPSPVAATTYGAFGVPRINASDNIAFRNKLVGHTMTAFLWDSSSTTTTALVALNDPTPIGGAIRSMRDIQLGDGDQLFLNAKLKRGAPTFGIFSYTPLASTILAPTDPPPPDLPGGQYKRLAERFALASDGTIIALQAKLRDGSNNNAEGVYRCQ